MKYCPSCTTSCALLHDRLVVMVGADTHDVNRAPLQEHDSEQPS